MKSTYVSPIFVLVCLGLIELISLVSGYYLDISKFGFFVNPLGVLLLFLFSVIVTVRVVIRLLNPRNWLRKNLIVACSCICVWIIFRLAPLPSNIDFAAKRLGQYPEEEYKEISEILVRLSEKHEMLNRSGSVAYSEYNAFISDLKKEHALFGISTFPLDIFIRDGYVSIEWASGLSGGFEVIILKESEPPDWLINVRHRYVHDSVVVFYKS